MKVYDINVDLFRSSLSQLDESTIRNALSWSLGQGSFPKPCSIQLNLTSRCLGRCIHCQQWTWPESRELTISECVKLMDVFYLWGVKSLTLSGGNPLLHSEIEVVLKEADERGISTGIITEGAEINESLLEAICKYASWIRFSLDGPDIPTHSRIRRVPMLFSYVISGIKKLQGKGSSLRIGINCVVQKENVYRLSDLLILSKRLNVDSISFKLGHSGQAFRYFLLDSYEWKVFNKWVEDNYKTEDANKTNLPLLYNLLDNIFDKYDCEAGTPVRSYYMKNNIKCFAPMFIITCDYNGDLYPCCYLLGDNRDSSLNNKQTRRQFRIGNVLRDTESALKSLEYMMQTMLHHMPSTGYKECGCCTRFWQLNGALSHMAMGSLMHSPSYQKGNFISLNRDAKKTSAIFL